MSTTKSHPLAEIKECPEKPWGMLHLMGRAGLRRQEQGCGVGGGWKRQRCSWRCARMVGTRRVLAGGAPSPACGVLTFHPGWNHLAVAFLHWAVNSCWGQNRDSSLPSAPSPPSSRAAKGLDASLLKIPAALLKLEEGMQISAKEGESSKVHFLHPPVV